ncbi:hypothetical protein [Formosa algae]|uniref:hypothetical protein n=1 Tax=Formosa algae TaxID=225843 RepID=UPI000CCDDE71|nr:hypothetical protein [Formosa algae]PNW28434.1 hypothetical protein BKP44_08610 [Formosa algae]
MDCRKVKFIFIVVLVLIFSNAYAITLDLSSIFSYGMVLQQGQYVPIWGSSAPNSMILITFSGQEKITKANEKGEWVINLDPLKASSAHEILTIKSSLNGEPLKRFQICDKSRVWKWANAQIIDTNKVEVWHETIANLVEVRYAWSSNPEGANLYNKEGLPASIFKTRN